MKDSDEFSFLKETFKSLGNQYFDSSEIIIGPGDDAGLVRNSQDTIYSVDASVAGVHFPENLAAEHVAFRSLSTAASDVVKMDFSIFDGRQRRFTLDERICKRVKKFFG